MLGVIEFGMLFAEYIFLQVSTDHVAQGAARLGGNVPALSTVKNNSYIAWMDPSQAQFTVDTLDTDGAVLCNTDLRILFFQADLTLGVQDSLFCWRGGSP
jgi:hypothetical protein